MYWVSDSMRPVYGPLRVIALVLMGYGMIPASTAQSDTLTLREKQTINALAEGRLKEYVWMLKYIADLTDSDDDALAGAEYIQEAIEGDIRVFYNASTVIEDNVDPALGPGSKGLERKADEYLKELRLHFKKEADAVDHKLALRGEPKAGPIISTSLLYEVQLKGTHTDRPGIPYKRHKRIMELIAERQGEGKWNVLIASDVFYDSTKTFTQFRVDKALDEAKATGAAETPELAAYREAARQAQEAVEAEKAARKAAYEQAIQKGQEAVVAGDFDIAIALYAEARKNEPFSIDPLILTKKAEKARDVKLQRDKARFEELLHQAEELKVMREYERALVAVQEGLKILPDDTRGIPLRDSLQEWTRQKADREAAYTMGNHEATIKACKDRLKIYPADAEALTLLAKCYHKLNKPADALDNAQRALKIEPFLGEALYLRAQLLEESGTEDNRRQASVDYDLLVRHDPWKAEYVHRHAQLVCFLLGNCAKASQLLKESLLRDPNNVQTLYWLGRVHGLGQTGTLLEYDVSIKYLDQAIAIDSACGVCHLERGVSLLMNDSSAAAEESVAMAKRFALPEKEWERVRNLAEASNAEGKDKEIKGFHAQAMKPFATACVLHPDKAIYWSDNARNLMKIPHYQEAIDALDRYIALVDADYNGRLDRGYCLLKLKRYDAALTEVERVTRNDVRGDFADRSYRLSGEAYFMKGDYASAERDLKESYRRRRENPDVLSMLAQTMYARGSYEEAEKFAENAIDVVKKAKGAAGPEDPKSYFYLGLIRQQLGKTNASIEMFQEARLLGYKLTEVEKQIGESLKRKGDCKNAILSFEEVLRDTMDRAAVMSIVECHKKEKAYDQALRRLNDLEKSQPDVAEDPEYLAEKGYLFVLNDMMTDANTALTAAYAADPDYRKTILARIAMFWKGGRQDEAVKDLSGLISRGQVTEKELKDWPILDDMIGSRLWKDR